MGSLKVMQHFIEGFFLHSNQAINFYIIKKVHGEMVVCPRIYKRPQVRTPVASKRLHFHEYAKIS